MKKLPKQECTAEFKELAVRRVKDGQSNGVVALELGLSDPLGRIPYYSEINP